MNINDKVVCVDDSPRPDIQWRFPPSSWLVESDVYVIQDTQRRGNLFGYKVVGIFGGLNALDDTREMYWDSTRFRLLSEVQAEAQAKKNQLTEPV